MAKMKIRALRSFIDVSISLSRLSCKNLDMAVVRPMALMLLSWAKILEVEATRDWIFSFQTVLAPCIFFDV